MILVVAPRKGQLSGRETSIFGNFGVRLHGHFVLAPQVPIHESWKHVEPSVGVDFFSGVFSRQDPSCQGRIGQQTNVVMKTSLGQSRLIILSYHQ